MRLYNGRIYGEEVSQYGLENGYLDYRLTIIKEKVADFAYNNAETIGCAIGFAAVITGFMLGRRYGLREFNLMSGVDLTSKNTGMSNGIMKLSDLYTDDQTLQYAAKILDTKPDGIVNTCTFVQKIAE